MQMTVAMALWLYVLDTVHWQPAEPPKKTLRHGHRAQSLLKLGKENDPHCLVIGINNQTSNRHLSIEAVPCVQHMPPDILYCKEKKGTDTLQRN